ncbi:MAG TPA: aminotransferase class IV [Candidatus Saccharimonadales bacterium]|nr:aminotransferase class IV [Candidatus Saccharimonadales bacterium]
MSEDNPGIVYINGGFLAAKDAKVSVFDQGFLFGDGVFDTMIVKNGFLFNLNAHVDRLFRSMKAVKLEISLPREALKTIIIETVKKTGLRDAYVKAIITRGVGKKPVLGRGETVHPTVVVFAVPPVSIVSQEKIDQGAKLTSTVIKRSLDPRVKTLDYLPNMLMRLEAIENGADEAISYDNDGHITEAGAANIFIAKDGVLKTPVSGALEGITREAIMEIAQLLGYKVTCTALTQYDLYTADEVLISSTAGGIFPVTTVDGRKIADGKVGKMSREILNHYNQWLSEGVHGTAIYKP